DDDVAWWVDSGATIHVCKDRCWFKTYKSLNDGSILYMGNELTALVHRRGCVDLRLNIVNDNNASAFMSTSKLNDSILWHARLGHVHFKRMQDMSKDGLILAFDMDTKKCKTCMLTKITKKPFENVKRKTEVLELIHSDLCDLHATPSLGNKIYFVTFIDDASRFCYVYLLHTKDEALDKFKVFKTEVELQQGSMIKRFRTDMGGKYTDNLYFQSIGIIHETIAPILHNKMLNLKGKIRVPNKRNKITPYELWTKRKPNLNYLRVWGCRAVVRLHGPKLKTFDEIGIECIFVRYAEHSKAFRFSSVPSQVSVFLKELKKLVVQWSLKSSLKRLQTSWLQMDLQKKTEAVRISTIRLLIAMASIHNLIIHQIDVKTTFLNGELDEEVYMNQPQGFIMPGNENKVDLTKEFFSSRFSMKDIGEADAILGVRIKHESNGIAISQSHYIEKSISQLEYSRVISCLMYAMTYTRPDIAFTVRKLSYLSVLEGYTDASWISNTKDNSSTSGWVFLLGEGTKSWAFKKQTCITSSTMESKFVALEVAYKEAE
ncbi:zinc finger, CCHC-type containing protein, partial [Tanacetum coccineum]